MSESDKVILRLCATCLPEIGDARFSQMTRAIAQAGLKDRVEVVTQDCMNACATPVSLSLQGIGRATYFFAGIDFQDGTGDIVATLHAYLASPTGWIEDASVCGRLRYCLVGRVPTLDSNSGVALPKIPGQTAQ